MEPKITTIYIFILVKMVGIHGCNNLTNGPGCLTSLTAGRKVIGRSVDQTNLGLSSIKIKGGRKVENDARINRIELIEL